VTRRYLEHPPRFQVLHCLRNRVKGGKSLFVDALHAAYSLSVEDIEVLASTPVAFHYENEKHHLYGAHPTLELAEASPYTSMTTTNVIEEGSSLGSASSALNALNGRIITHVNYSPPFQAPLPPNTPPSFFGAFARFEALLRQPAARFEYRLQEGDAVLFDNRRMFHARGPYDAQQEGAAVHDRWLKGGYFEADEVMDKRRMLMRKLGMLPA
jgi:gamma-butyrobetaine dioxygenase